MAKIRPIVPGCNPNTPKDRAPDLGTPRPDERNPAFQEIGQKIIDEWRSAVAQDRALDRERLERDITSRLRLDDPNGAVEVGVIVDPKPDRGRKFVWIVIPYPDAPENVDLSEWIDTYDQNEDLKTRLGEAVLFGCGR